MREWFGSRVGISVKLARTLLWGCLCVVLLGSLVGGCATRNTFRRGEAASVAGDWDAAVEYHRRAVQDDPDNPVYRIAFERAMLSAAKAHLLRAQELEGQGEITDAIREYRLAAEFDPGNTNAAGRARELERLVRDRAEAARPKAPIEELRERVRQQTQPVLLDPTLSERLQFQFVDAGLRDILDFIGEATGVNVTYDQQFQDRAYSVRLDGVTVEEALDQILTANQYFYKVINPRALIIVPDTPQKRAQYEQQVIRTFYVSNADVQELATLLSQIVRVPQMAVQPQIVPNITANSITVRATTAVAAVIEQVIASNDKPRAEIVVDVEILEVNRERAREFGLDLAQYAVGGVFSPDSSASSSGTTNGLDASSAIRSGDMFLSVPSAVIRFLESDSETRLVAKPQLRGQEGATLTLNLGDDIPVPATAFTPIAAGGVSVNPLTSFNYRPVGVIVEMTPRVTYENEIILDLLVENSTLGPSINVAGQALPTFGSRRVETRLRLRDGESNLLAGLLREEDRRSLRGFPGILRLPIIRHLLSANEDSIKQSDIIMLLTPRIVRTHELTEADVSPIHIGTQRNIGLAGPPRLIEPIEENSQARIGIDPVMGDSPARPSADSWQIDSDSLEGLESTATDAIPLVQPEVSRPSVNPQIFVTPPATDLFVGGGPYTVPISVAGMSQLSTLTLSLTFNPTALRVSTVQEGSFMRQGDGQVTFVQQVDTTQGRIDLALSRTNDAVGASGGGVIAAVIFEAVAPGPVVLTPSGLGFTPEGSTLSVEFSPVTLTVR